MSLLNRGKLDIKLGEYAVGQSASALVDPLLVARAQDYRRNTAARMIPLETSDILKRLPPADYHVSLKLDGEFNLLVYEDGEALFINPGGTVRTGLPVLHEAIELLKKAKVKRAIIAGELYFMRDAGKRTRVHDVCRVARQPASQGELDALGFAAFDIVEIDGKPAPAAYADTWKRLTELFKSGKRTTVVEAVWLKEAPAIEAQYKKWIEQGAEGAVVRSDAIGMFKVKPRHTIDAAVIGFTEGTEDRRGMIHDLLVALMRADGSLHVLGHVGGGFSNDDRRAFLSDLKDMIVESDYAEVNDQVAYHMVRPEWVIEISILDLISQTTRGAPINKMVLHWNAGASKYEIVRRLPHVAIISPQFVRRREDKSVNKQDIRIQQVSDIVEVPLVDRDARKLDLPTSNVLRREVCTKVLKGATMVRKLLMWQTNKDRDGDDFPAFVIHYTDFSPNRKTPLEREIRVSSSKDQIEELWRELADDAFTKGWSPVACVSATATQAAKPQAASQTEEGTSTAVAQAGEAPKKHGKKAAAPVEPSEPAPTAEEPTEKPAPKKRASPKKKKE